MNTRPSQPPATGADSGAEPIDTLLEELRVAFGRSRLAGNAHTDELARRIAS